MTRLTTEWLLEQGFEFVLSVGGNYYRKQIEEDPRAYLYFREEEVSFGVKLADESTGIHYTRWLMQVEFVAEAIAACRTLGVALKLPPITPSTGWVKHFVPGTHPGGDDDHYEILDSQKRVLLYTEDEHLIDTILADHATGEKLRKDLAEFRDSVLHDRHQLAEAGMTNELTNAVLGLFDDTLGSWMEGG